MRTLELQRDTIGKRIVGVDAVEDAGGYESLALVLEDGTRVEIKLSLGFADYMEVRVTSA